MTLKSDANFKGKLACGLKNDLNNLVNFHANSRKSGNLHSDVLLLSKAYKNGNIILKEHILKQAVKALRDIYEGVYTFVIWKSITYVSKYSYLDYLRPV